MAFLTELNKENVLRYLLISSHSEMQEGREENRKGVDICLRTEPIGEEFFYDSVVVEIEIRGEYEVDDFLYKIYNFHEIITLIVDQTGKSKTERLYNATQNNVKKLVGYEIDVKSVSGRVSVK